MCFFLLCRFKRGTNQYTSVPNGDHCPTIYNIDRTSQDAMSCGHDIDYGFFDEKSVSWKSVSHTRTSLRVKLRPQVHQVTVSHPVHEHRNDVPCDLSFKTTKLKRSSPIWNDRSSWMYYPPRVLRFFLSPWNADFVPY